MSVEHLPVVSAIIPPDIRRDHLVLSLANKATRFKHNMFKMGLRASSACERGAAKQTAHHFCTTCPINRAPNNLSGENLDDAAIHWLEGIDV